MNVLRKVRPNEKTAGSDSKNDNENYFDDSDNIRTVLSTWLHYLCAMKLMILAG